jgi:hypothetical protein
VHEWAQLKNQAVVHFDYNYLATGLLWLSCALIGIAAAVYAASRRSLYGLALVIAAASGVLSTISLPDVGPEVQMMTGVTRLLGHADRSLALWDEAHGRFPESDAELLDALKARPLGEGRLFAIGSRGLPYAVRLIADANGPYAATAPSSPGVFVYAVRQDSGEYWLTVTTLDKPVAGRVVFHRVAGDYLNGKLWVMNRTHRQDGQPQKGFIE